MSELANADIFFIITSAAVILIAAGIITAIIYIIRILRTVDEISHTVREESEHIVDDIAALRANMRPAQVIGGVAGFLKGIFTKAKRRTHKRK